MEDGSLLNEIAYTSAVSDSNTGLYYMNARYNNPNTGRFLSQDSYKGSMYEPWTQNLYSYVGNNPVNFTDPTSHNAIVIEVLGIGLLTLLLGIADAMISIDPDISQSQIYAAMDTAANKYVDEIKFKITSRVLVVGYFAMIIDMAKASHVENEKTKDKEEEKEEEKDNKTPKPPLDKYPEDANDVPDDWEWQDGGKNSDPADEKGNWTNPNTGETLHPDLKHKPPVNPHWDYWPYKGSPGYRWYPDGRMVPK